MKTSVAGRALIEQREGRRLTAYRDTRGILTIGVGHTGRMSGPPVTPDMRITEAQCDAMLAADLAPVEQVLDAALKVPVSQSEFDALASLGFNVGATGLKNSTAIRRLNRGDIAGAADAFMMWTHPAGLAGRRAAEKAQFLASDVGAQAVATARAATLSTMADATKATAHKAQSGAAALVAIGTAAAVTTHHHHFLIALVVGGLVLAAGVAAAFVAVRRHRAAQALAINAGHQTGAAIGTASTALADFLKQ